MRNVIEPRREIRQEFETKMVEIINQCREKAKGKLIPIPPLIFKRLGTPVGMCHMDILKGNTVFINPDFFEKDYSGQLNETLPHEVAHHVTEVLFGWRARSHGYQWRMVMSWIGADSSRCHNMDVTSARLRQVDRPFKYLCGCKVHMLTRLKHDRIQSHGKRYVCRLCRKTLVYERQATGELRPLVTSSIPISKLPVVSREPAPISIVPKPLPPSTHRAITVFENGMLITQRITLTE